jgi:hypothetical protein
VKTGNWCRVWRGIYLPPTLSQVPATRVGHPLSVELERMGYPPNKPTDKPKDAFVWDESKGIE